MTGPGNADRAAWADRAIGAFQSAAGHHGGLDTAEVIGSLITALCHYADRRGISFGTILTASSDGTARLWTPPPPTEGKARDVTKWLEVLTGVELDADQTVHMLPADAWLQRR